jgi:tetratricopeptide (TPR) repeat protein
MRPSFRFLSFGIFWFFIALSVESSVIPITDVIFEHRLYLPSIGVILAVTMLMDFVYGSVFRGKHGMAFRLFVLMGILALSIATFQRNMIWGSTLSLWEDVVRKSPGKARPYNHLGIALTLAGRNDEAYRSLIKAVELKPNYPDDYNNLGIALANKGMPDLAIEMFLTSIRLNPNFPLPYGNLGRLYLLEKGDYNSAIDMSRTAIELNPYYTDAYVNLAASYNQLGDFNKVVQLLEGANRYLEEVPEAHYNLGVAYYRSGNSAGADRELAIVKRLDAGLALTLERVMAEARNDNR